MGRQYIDHRLKKMGEALNGSRLRVSQRGVPHLVVPRGLRSFSVTYFASTDTWKVFWPWPTYGRQQRSRSFHSDGAVVRFLEGAVA